MPDPAQQDRVIAAWECILQIANQMPERAGQQRRAIRFTGLKGDSAKSVIVFEEGEPVGQRLLIFRQDIHRETRRPDEYTVT